MPIIRATELTGPIDLAETMPALRIQAASLVKKVTLDRRSRALVAALAPIDWTSNSGERGAELDALVANFEQQIALDTAINEHAIRSMISRRFANAENDVSFGKLNEWIYATLFRTPAADPWLGMGAVGTFTALPNSGVESVNLATSR
jgi:hypothetical protein